MILRCSSSKIKESSVKNQAGRKGLDLIMCEWRCCCAVLEVVGLFGVHLRNVCLDRGVSEGWDGRAVIG